MAAKKTTTKRKRQSKDKPDDLILDAALEWAAKLGWRSLNMSDLAEATGLTLAEIHAIYPCKQHILNGLVRRVDEQIFASGDADGDGIRDRLFDMLMRRFDVLNPLKPAITAIARDSWCDPVAFLITGPRMLSSMYWMLEAAGASPNGLIGAARCKVLGLIYANAFRVWLRDDTQDMARTMAALDRGLQQAERLECRSRGR